MLRITILVVLAAASVSAQDSPLVALAKRTNRAASKTPVITNETLARSRGRLSTPAGETATASNAQPAFVPSAAPSQPVAPRTPQAPVTEPATPPGYPAASTVRNVEPQSSAQFVNPQSTARTIVPASGATHVNPQSTAQTVQPASTARNIPPQTTTTPPR